MMKALIFFLIFLFVSITVGAAEPMQNSWLIVNSDGSILTYDGSKFHYIASLGSGTYTVESNGRYWLIKKQNINGTEFFIFDGKVLKNLTQEIIPILRERNLRIIYHMKWGGGKWLITSSNAVVEFNGSEFVAYPAPAGIQLVETEPVWNGEYWLMAGSASGEPVLIRYRDRSWKVMSLSDRGMKGEIRDIAWNGDYWLICAYFYSEETGILPKLYKYDGLSLAEVPLPKEILKRGESGDVPVIATWNGEGWVIGVEKSGVLFTKLVRFDGDSFKLIHEVGKSTHPLLTDARIEDIRCNDAYCLIYFQNMRQMGILAKYERNELHVLDNIPGFTSLISDYRWNGDYWLIGEYSLTGKSMLLKYNGSDFVELTDIMLSALPTTSEEIKPGRIVFSSLLKQETLNLETNKGVCGPTVVVIVSVFTIVLIRRRTFNNKNTKDKFRGGCKID